jgi:hypothetical protein
VSGLRDGQGSAYGAFHIQGKTQTDFDRIVLDSLNSSGDYSAGSGLGTSMVPTAVKGAVFAPHRGPSDLLGVIHGADHRLAAAKTEQIRQALRFADQSVAALASAIETRKTSAAPRVVSLYLVDDPKKDEKQNLVRPQSASACRAYTLSGSAELSCDL